MIVDPENLNNNIGGGGSGDGKDEFVDSSFMVSLKGNETASVSDKIKENNIFDDDEFDNFEFDPSKSAFKPLAGNAAPSSGSGTEDGRDDKSPFSAFDNMKSLKDAASEDVKPADIPEFAKVAAPDDPAFTDADLDFKEFTGVAEDKDPGTRKLFDAGNGLDFAGSNSAFAGARTDDAGPKQDNLQVNPFKPNPEKEQKPAQAQEPPKSPNANSTADSSNLKTYGKVTSGVDAFKRPAPEGNTESATEAVGNDKNSVPEEAQPAGKPVAQKTAAASDKKTDSPISPKPEEIKTEDPAPEAKKEETSPSPFVQKKAEPVRRPTSNAAKVAASSPAPRTQASKQPGSANGSVQSVSQANRPIARPVPPAAAKQQGNTASRPGTAQRPVSAASSRTASGAAVGAGANKAPAAAGSAEHQNKNIAPVTTVSKSGKKSRKNDKVKKEPGKGGIFALIGVLALIFIVLWIVDNYDVWFKKDSDKTVPTQVTAVTAASSTTQSQPEETAVSEETEETAAQTSEETTEPEETEETEETSESVETAEASEIAETEETEETAETATETTGETTAETTRRSSSNAPVSCSYTIVNPHTLEDGFSFDIAITNNGEDLNMSRLDELTITISTDTTVTALTSDYYTFTAGEQENSFVGHPRSNTIPSGETVNTTITAATQEHVVHFTISNYHFEWN